VALSQRCAKATNSKAVGGTQPTALPSIPCAVFSDGMRGRRTVRVASPPSVQSGTRPVRGEDNKYRATVLKGACELSPWFHKHHHFLLHKLSPGRLSFLAISFT